MHAILCENNSDTRDDANIRARTDSLVVVDVPVAEVATSEEHVLGSHPGRFFTENRTPNRTEPKPNRKVGSSVFQFGFGFQFCAVRCSASASVSMPHRTEVPRNR